MVYATVINSSATSAADIVAEVDALLKTGQSICTEVTHAGNSALIIGRKILSTRSRYIFMPRTNNNVYAFQKTSDGTFAMYDLTTLYSEKTLSMDGIIIPDGLTISAGGYCRIGNMVYVSMTMTASDTSKTYEVKGFPAPLRYTALESHVKDRCHTAYISSDTLYIKANATNGIQLSGMYVASD